MSILKENLIKEILHLKPIVVAHGFDWPNEDVHDMNEIELADLLLDMKNYNW